jgi:aspartyl-tRNA(Asn)/glutamyl-tRNA(Gln) amidotransferase subunit A
MDTIKAIADLLASGKASSTEICKDYLARITARNAVLNAFITVDADKTLAEARAADDEIGRAHV